MIARLHIAARMADELVESLRDALAQAGRVESILIIQQLESACSIRSALDTLRSAMEDSEE